MNSEEVNIEDFQRGQREFKNLLILKTKQVEQLRKDLDAEIFKNYKTNLMLQDANAKVEAQNFRLNCELKKSKTLASKLQEDASATANSERLKESFAIENVALQEVLLESETAKRDLMRQLDDFKTQRQFDSNMQKKLTNENAELRKNLAKIDGTLKDCQTTHSQVIELCNKNEHKFEEIKKRIVFYKNETARLREHKRDSENDFIIMKSKMEKLEEMLSSALQTQTSPDTSSILEQWKESNLATKNRLKSLHDIIENLSAKLQTEQEVNVKLCLNETLLREKIEEFTNEKLKMNVSQTDEKKNIIKSEIIEID